MKMRELYLKGERVAFECRGDVAFGAFLICNTCLWI